MPEPIAADTSRCPRCGRAFHCGVDDSGRCWCADLTLAPDALAALARQYRSCLCAGCLGALDAATPRGES